MREIKFRGKRVDNGEWMFGSLLDGDIIVTKESVDVDEDYIGINEWSSVDPSTIGQLVSGNKFTGDIFAIVCDCDSEYGCSHRTENWELIFNEEYLQYGYSKGDKFVLLDEFVEECIHYIGNRWDNPELLEG